MISVTRWFGIVRKRDGKYVYGFTLVEDCPLQDTFLKKVMKFEKGDRIMELLQSTSWQPKDFIHYFTETYQKPPKVD